MAEMRLELADELEEFVRVGALWDPVQLQALVDGLEAEGRTDGGTVTGLLARPLRSVLIRIGMGPLPVRTASDLEAIVYPRLWKVMEGVRDGMPDGEMRTRVEVFNRRLARYFAREPSELGS
jgi:hypothetical protein